MTSWKWWSGANTQEGQRLFSVAQNTNPERSKEELTKGRPGVEFQDQKYLNVNFSG